MDLRVRLPVNVAAEVAQVQRDNPEILSRMVVYTVTRRAFYRQLATSPGGRTSVHRASDAAVHSA